MKIFYRGAVLLLCVCLAAGFAGCKKAEEEPEAIIACEGLTLATSSITFDEPERFYNITVQKLPEMCDEDVTFSSSEISLLRP